MFSSASLEALLDLVRNMFLCSLVWSVGGLLDRGDRPKFDAWLRRKVPAGLPGTSVGESDSVFNWIFDVFALEWQRFQVPEFVFPKQVCVCICGACVSLPDLARSSPSLSRCSNIVTDELIQDCEVMDLHCHRLVSLRTAQITSQDMTPSHDGACGVFDSSNLLVPTIDTHQARSVLAVRRCHSQSCAVHAPGAFLRIMALALRAAHRVCEKKVFHENGGEVWRGCTTLRGLE